MVGESVTSSQVWDMWCCFCVAFMVWDLWCALLSCSPSSHSVPNVFALSVMSVYCTPPLDMFVRGRAPWRSTVLGTTHTMMTHLWLNVTPLAPMLSGLPVHVELLWVHTCFSPVNVEVEWAGFLHPPLVSLLWSRLSCCISWLRLWPYGSYVYSHLNWLSLLYSWCCYIT